MQVLNKVNHATVNGLKQLSHYSIIPDHLRASCASLRVLTHCAAHGAIRSAQKANAPGLDCQDFELSRSTVVSLHQRGFSTQVLQACIRNRGLYRDEEWFWDSLAGTTAGGWRIIGLTVNRFPRDSHGALVSEMNNPPLWSCTWRVRSKARERTHVFSTLWTLWTHFLLDILRNLRLQPQFHIESNCL